MSHYYALIAQARQFALAAHNQQKYGIYPYEVHLGHVIAVLIKNGVGFITEQDYLLLASAWLHDTLEDTLVTKEQLIAQFGHSVTEIVEALTDGEGETRAERKELVYRKISENQQAMIVKLADRIANVEFSLIYGNLEKFAMYQYEQRDLQYYLSAYINTELGKQLFNYLNQLLVIKVDN